MLLTDGTPPAVPFSVANLTDTGGSHTFTVDAWTGTGTLTNNGATSDTLDATKNASFRLANTELKSTDGMDLLRAGRATTPFSIANLTDTGGGHIFAVAGWTGFGTLLNDGTSGDTINAIKDASFTLSNTELQTTDGMNLTLGGTAVVPFSKTNLTDTGGGKIPLRGGWVDRDRDADEQRNGQRHNRCDQERKLHVVEHGGEGDRWNGFAAGRGGDDPILYGQSYGYRRRTQLYRRWLDGDRNAEERRRNRRYRERHEKRELHFVEY